MFNPDHFQNVQTIPFPSTKTKQLQELEERVRTQTVRAAIYYRVSTDTQEEDGTSLETQEENCLLYCNMHGYRVMSSFREVFTGMLYRERPELSKLRMMVRNREIDVVVIHSVERLSRVTLHIAVLLEEMLSHQVKLECVTEQIDTSPMGQMVIQLLALAGQIEKERMEERLSRQREKRIAEGKLIGSGTPLYGYKWENPEKTRYAIDEVTSEIVSLIFEMFVVQRKTLWQIAKFLTKRGTPTPGSLRIKKRSVNKGWATCAVSRILKHPAYCGMFYAKAFKPARHSKSGKRMMVKGEKPILLPNVAPPLVPRSMFEQAQELLKENRSHAARNSVEPNDSLLLKHGPVKCGYCKRNLSKHSHKMKSGERVLYYSCMANQMANSNCPFIPAHRALLLDREVWSFVSSLLERAEKIKQRMLEEMKKEITDTNEIDRTLTTTEDRIRRISKERDQMPEDSLTYQEKTLQLAQAEKQRKDLLILRERAMPSVEQQKQHQEEVLLFINWLTNLVDPKQASLSEKKFAIKMLGIQVWVYSPKDKENPRYRIEAKKAITGENSSLLR